MPIPKDDLQASVDVFDTLEWIIVLYVGRRSETLRRRWAWLDVEKMEDGECSKIDCATDKEHLARLNMSFSTYFLHRISGGRTNARK